MTAGESSLLPWVTIRCLRCGRVLLEMKGGVVRKICPRCGAIVVVAMEGKKIDRDMQKGVDMEGGGGSRDSGT